MARQTTSEGEITPYLSESELEFPGKQHSMSKTNKLSATAAIAAVRAAPSIEAFVSISTTQSETRNDPMYVKASFSISVSPTCLDRLNLFSRDYRQ